MDAFNQILTSEKYHDLFAIIKGFRNGAVYGAKIRFPHALVMTFLFRSGTARRTKLTPLLRIVLYLFSRIMMGLAKLTVKKGVIPQPPHTSLYLQPLFGEGKGCSAGSLQASMQYLYNDSEVFSNLRNWIWHNR
ncbi:hypothetical protein BC829DRAFT_412426 [Chytridium lagenaria]|nr:hypothetical protein BC829DRAFT_412426 [Chytridium lagenaria]